MTFSISEMIVDHEQNVVALNWAYSNPDGTLSNQHVLEKPYGSTPLVDVTTPIALQWLGEQLGNTAEEFDASIAEAKAAQEYNSQLVAYEPHESGPPTPTPTEETPEVEADVEVEVETAPKPKPTKK
tara:strand:- start:1197 stop:1577 length:381 start_codon:yes stop_codon:yes gene_type:complete